LIPKSSIIVTPHLSNIQNHLVLTQHIPGVSGSASNFYFQTKALTGQSVIQGLVQQINSGNILNGNTFGTFYQSTFSGAFTTAFPNVYIALGSNPNNVVLPSASIPFPGTSSSFNFTSIKMPGAGGVSLVPLAHLSGAQAASRNQLNRIISNGVAGGRQLANTGLTGGYLTSTGFENAGVSTYDAFGRVGLAFGNSPFNTNIFQNGTATFPNAASYLNFKNHINLSVSSSQISGQLFENFATHPAPLVHDGYFVLAGGSNPANIQHFFLGTIFGPPVTVPSFVRVTSPMSNFAAFLSLKHLK
jgi:hypothetical protein